MSTNYYFPDITWHLKYLYKKIYLYIWALFNPIIEIKGIKIPIDKKYSVQILDSLYTKFYEFGELNIIEKTLEKGDLVLELGAGLGLISAYCAKRIGNDNVHTIEANIRIKSAIQQLYKLNNVEPNIEFGVAGLSEKIVTFYFEPKDIWSSSTIKLSNTSKPIIVKEIDCNELLNTLKPNYLIIDIEGGEYELLPQLNLNFVNKLQIEFHAKHIGQAKIDELIEYLIDLKFKIDYNFTISEQFFFYK